MGRDHRRVWSPLVLSPQPSPRQLRAGCGGSWTDRVSGEGDRIGPWRRVISLGEKPFSPPGAAQGLWLPAGLCPRLPLHTARSWRGLLWPSGEPDREAPSPAPLPAAWRAPGLWPPPASRTGRTLAFCLLRNPSARAWPGVRSHPARVGPTSERRERLPTRRHGSSTSSLSAPSARQPRGELTPPSGARTEEGGRARGGGPGLSPTLSHAHASRALHATE